MDRRQFVSALGACPLLAAAGALPRAARAAVQIGDATLTSVPDGSITLPASFSFSGMPQDELALIREEFGVTGDQTTRPCNVTLLQTPDRTVLFDVGSGQEFMDSVGNLLEELDSLGVTPEDVTDVVFTHAHPDHLWGLLDDFGDPAFSEARFFMGQVEFDYWMNPNTVTEISEDRVPFAVGAQRRLELIADQITFFGDGEEILPGVAARATYGHTPGHMSFEVRSGTEATMILGDAITNHHVGFLRPDWPAGSDQNPEQASKTRASLLDQLATDQTRILGFHLPGNGIGHVTRKGDEFRFEAEET